MNICLICLRTDRLLKIANIVLKEFHDELCEVSVLTVALCCYYCSECEYLLTKFYKFKQKCVKALKIYQKWMSAKAGKKQPINLLYKLLPPASLSMWSPNPRIANFTFKSTESQPDLHTEEELLKNTLEVKLEYEQCYSDNIKVAAVLKTENTDNLESVRIDEINKDVETEDTLFGNIDGFLEELSDAVTSENRGNADLLIAKPDNEVLDTFSDSSTELIVTQSAEVSDNINILKPKKKEKIKENLLRSKKNIKMKSTKRKTYFEKYTENDKQYKSVFDIEYLTTPEMKLEEFERRRTYQCYVKAEHKCEICYQVVKSSKFLEYHMNKWHNNSPGSVLCPICKTWNSKRSKHKSAHVVVFKCKLCPLITHRRTTMINHFEQHKGKLYHCEQCNITYKSNSAYRNHAGKAHRRGRNVCEGCGRGFGSPMGLTVHKNNSFRCTVAKEPSNLLTESTEGVRCDDCDVTLPSQEVYDAHIVDVHEPRRKRTLTINNAGLTKSKVFMDKSRKRVRRAPEHTCRVCSKVGSSFSWLQLHFKREHPDEDLDALYADKKTHLCDICGTGFSTMFGLRNHMNVHTGARPHACDLCPKQFRSAIKMREHRARHFPASIPCTHCGKQFKSKANLYTHKMTHTGEKNHKCDICGKGFSLPCNLKEHVRGVHYNIRRVKRGAAREGAADTGAKRTKRRITMPDDTETDSDSSDSSD